MIKWPTYCFFFRALITGIVAISMIIWPKLKGAMEGKSTEDSHRRHSLAALMCQREYGMHLSGHTIIYALTSSPLSPHAYKKVYGSFSRNTYQDTWLRFIFCMPRAQCVRAIVASR